MTIEQRIQIIKEAYYMTQYASYSGDNGVYQALISSLEANGTDFNMVMEFLKLTHDATDFINQKVYNSVFYNLTDESIEILTKLYKAIEDESIGDLEDLFDMSYYDLFDGYVGYSYDFEMIADDYLKNSGIDSNAIYWAYKIPSDDNLYELDCYNHFNEITFDDIVERLFEQHDLDDIL